MTRSDGGAAREVRGAGRAAAKAERRLQLIEATITSIARDGLSGTTLARVTAIAGASVGLANFHFETKERLFEAVLTHLGDEQRAHWRRHDLDPTRSATERLMAIIESRFHPSICDRRKLAIWFAFYGDAGARDIYRRVMSDVDDERLYATIAILREMIVEGGYVGMDPEETALTMEALYDGLWLNMLLYPSEFELTRCRRRALDFAAAILPRHFERPGASG